MQESNVVMAPTLIKIKRKRTEEPLDALVIEEQSRRKKTRGSSGFFQFVETVDSETFWRDEIATKDLKDRISSLANNNDTVPSERSTKSATDAPTRRYTIVQKPTEAKAAAPPVVHSSKELQKQSQAAGNQDNDYTLYEAVLDAPSNEPVDSEMEKFLPMLQEYLRMNDEPANITNAPAPSSSSNENEYVWDVFYHRPTITSWAAAASNINIATITGLPSSQEGDSDSASEAGDTDDEDSNTEDFYRNDYPDEDPDESDDSHHLSDYDHDYNSEEDEVVETLMTWHRR